MKEASGTYGYNPAIKTSLNNVGDGFYTTKSSMEEEAEKFYKKYIELRERLKKLDIENKSEYINSEEADKIYHEDDKIYYGDGWDDEEDVEDEEEFSPMYDNYEERQVDMLSLPVYYHIAFAIPADLSFGSATARQIDAFYGLRDKLEKAVEKYEDECEDLETGWLKAGDTICVENIFVMLTTNKKYQRPTLDTIRSCVRVIAEECYENKIRYLAMPRVGCGHGHLNWDVVKEAILDEFDNYFDEMDEEEYRPFITFCYQ